MSLPRPSVFGVCALALVSFLPTAQACEGLRGKVAGGQPIALGVSPSSPPLSSVENGRATGYIVDICRAAIERGARIDDLPEPVFTHQIVDGINAQFDALGQNSIDVVCTPTTHTVARRSQHDVGFSLSVFFTGADFIYRAGDDVTELSDLAGSTITAVEDTTTIAGLRAALTSQGLEEQVTVMPVDSHATGIDLLLKRHGIRAHAGDQAILAPYLKDEPGLRLTGELKSFEPYAIAIARCDTEGLDFLDRGIAQLFRSGDIWPIYNRNFPGLEPGALLIATYIIGGLPD